FSYSEAMLRYGSDKPDLRYGLEIVDITELAKLSTFKVFTEAAEKGHVVRGLNAKGAADKFSNTELKPGGKLASLVGQYGAKGRSWFKARADKLESSIEKSSQPPFPQERLREAMNAQDGDVLLFVADTEDVACQALGGLRTHLAAQLKLYQNWWD